MLHICGRNENALIACQTATHADIEKTFDLVIDAADGLHLPQLIDRTCDGQTLRNRHFGERGDERIKFRRRRAVAIDAAVGLFKNETGRHGEGDFRQEGRGQIT